LEKVIEVENAVAASFEYFDLVVEALHKATGVSVQEVVGDFVHIVIKGGQETIETGQPTGFNAPLPSPDLAGGLGFGQILLEDSRQFFPKGISQFQVGRVFKQAVQHVLFILRQVSRFLSEGPHRAFDLCILFLRQFILEPFEFLST